MRRNFLLIVLLCFSGYLYATDSHTTYSKNKLSFTLSPSFYPLSSPLPVPELSIGYTRALTSSISVEAAVFGGGLPFIGFGAGAELSLMFWPIGIFSDGLYAGPYLRGIWHYPGAPYGGIIIGGKAGWSWLWKNGFTFNLGAAVGGGYPILLHTSVDIGLGYAW